MGSIIADQFPPLFESPSLIYTVSEFSELLQMVEGSASE